MDFKNLKNIDFNHIKYLENKLLKNEFESIEEIIENLNKKIFNHPAIQLIYAHTKAVKKNSNLKEKKIAFNIFIETYKSNPHFKKALYNACTMCFVVKEYSKILILLEDFVSKNNYDDKIYNTLYKLYTVLGETNKANKFAEIITKKEPKNLEAWSAYIFTSLYLDKFKQKDAINLFNNFTNHVPKYDIKEKLPSQSYKSKIRIGFITPYFDGNSIDGFLLGLLENIDRNIFEVIGFNLGVSNQKSDHLINQFDDWNHVYNLKDLDLINYIRKKNVNILIDLVGHGPKNRLTIFKNRVSPIQISWLGYTNSTWLKEIDYIIADPHLIKKSEENLYYEKILYLPNIWNAHKEFDEKLKIENIPYDKNNHVTFGCFNNFIKISDNVIKIWSEILDKTNSKLILKSSMYDDLEIRERLLNKFPNDITDKKRIVILARQKEKQDHIKLYNKMDIGLDTFPYPGVTTTFEAIWMGVPILTMKGNNFTSRCGESINNNLNLKEFIADDENDYVEKAINFTKKIKTIKNLKINLREKAKNSPLFKTKDFTNQFCNELKNLWIKKSEHHKF
jgi:predicted O-linked N-acetylglucosamine transferase (SPINDLY family)